MSRVLTYRQPYDGDALFDFLRPRQIGGVELIEQQRYARTFEIGGVEGHVEAVHVPARSGFGVTIAATSKSVEREVLLRLRRLFDLDADPSRINATLGSDRFLARLVAARPGLRVPGAFDPFELAIRAILGQQISVTRATQLATRLVALFGRSARAESRAIGLTHFFPTPAVLARADVAKLGMPRSRVATIVTLAEAASADPSFFEGEPRAVREKLLAIKGIGDWTAQYISMRALRDADAFPSGDLGLQKALSRRNQRPSARETETRSEKWRPWRAYAALHLWSA